MEDPLLTGQGGISAGGSQYSFLVIPERNLTIVASYIQLIWRVKKFKKTVTPFQIIQNSKEIFEINTKKASDSLWKEHCASSLRELVDGQIVADFTYALKCLPKLNTNGGQTESIYLDLGVYKDILNELAHLNNGAALQKIKNISGFEHVESVDNQVFDKVCTNYIMLLYTLFRNNCMKGD